MGITVEFLTGLGLEKEVANKIFAERGKEVNADKGKIEQLESENAGLKERFENLSKDFNSLKESNASAEEWEQKYNDLVEENKQREQQAKEQERLNHIAERFNAVVGDRKFIHEAIQQAYCQKFTEALSNKEYEGKSDTEIFNLLTKDDATAFANVERLDLPGNQTTGEGDKTFTIPQVF